MVQKPSAPPGDDEARYCALCEAMVLGRRCPEHDVPTVAANAVEQLAGDEHVGRTLAGRYLVQRQLGGGAMGRVYVASQLAMGRAVALKTLHPRLVGDARALRRFYQEAQAASRLGGPNVVQIFDFGVDDEAGIPYIIMELLQGNTLAELLVAEGPLTPERTCALLAQVADGLLVARDAGVVHRDLKPGNIFVVPGTHGEAQVKVLDFGVAKLLDPSGAEAGISDLTRTGQQVGTPHYMSPEQVLGQPVDARSDLYALGCVLHRALTGSVPHDELGSQQLLARRSLEGPPQLPERLPCGVMPAPELRALQQRLLARSPEHRPELSWVAGALRALAAGETVPEEVAPEPRADVPPPPPLAIPERMAGDGTLSLAASAAESAPTRRRWRGAASLGVLALAVIVAALLYEAPKQTPQQPVPAPTSVARAPEPAAKATPVASPKVPAPTPQKQAPPQPRAVRRPRPKKPPPKPSPQSQPPPPPANPEEFELPWEPLE